MRRMYSKNQLEEIVGKIVEENAIHVYSLSKITSSANTDKETVIYIVSDKDIASASDLVADDINGKVINVNYYEEDSSGETDDIWVGLSHFSTNASGVVTFHRIKDSDESYAGISATNVTLATLKTYTLTKLV